MLTLLPFALGIVFLMLAVCDVAFGVRASRKVRK